MYCMTNQVAYPVQNLTNLTQMTRLLFSNRYKVVSLAKYYLRIISRCYLSNNTSLCCLLKTKQNNKNCNVILSIICSYLLGFSSFRNYERGTINFTSRKRVLPLVVGLSIHRKSDAM